MYEEESKHGLLTEEREKELGKAIARSVEMSERLESGEVQADADVERVIKEGGEAVSELVRNNLRLAMKVAWKFKRPHEKTLDDDLIQESIFGLMKAAWKFNPYKHNNKFSTYATWWCNQACQRAISDTAYAVNISPTVESDMRMLSKYMSSAEYSHGEVSLDDLANTLGWDRKYLDKILVYTERSIAKSLFSYDDDGNTIVLDVEDVKANNPEIDGVRPLFIDELKRAMRVLEPQERSVIEQHFGLTDAGPLELNEVGDNIGVTREKARQIQARGLSRLRHPSAGLVQYFSLEDIG